MDNETAMRHNRRVPRAVLRLVQILMALSVVRLLFLVQYLSGSKMTMGGTSGYNIHDFPLILLQNGEVQTKASPGPSSQSTTSVPAQRAQSAQSPSFPRITYWKDGVETPPTNFTQTHPRVVASMYSQSKEWLHFSRPCAEKGDCWFFDQYYEQYEVDQWTDTRQNHTCSTFDVPSVWSSTTRDDTTRPVSEARHYRTCNTIHEFQEWSPFDSHTESKRLGNGWFRQAFKVVLPSITTDTVSRKESGVVVMKLGNWLRNPTDPSTLEGNRIDATLTERLTSSPHVLSTYAYCANAAVTEAALGGDMWGYLDKNQGKMSPRQQLLLARDTAQAVAAVHSVRFAYMDIKSANFLVMNIDKDSGIPVIKANDFNTAFPMASVTGTGKDDGEYCRFRTSPPKAYRMLMRNVFVGVEKTPEYGQSSIDPLALDVFRLGFVFMDIFSRSMPRWKQESDAGFYPVETKRPFVSSAKAKGILKRVKEEISRLRSAQNDANVAIDMSKSVDFVLQAALVYAALACAGARPELRPTSDQVAKGLELILQRVDEVNQDKINGTSKLGTLLQDIPRLLSYPE